MSDRICASSCEVLIFWDVAQTVMVRVPCDAAGALAAAALASPWSCSEPLRGATSGVSSWGGGGCSFSTSCVDAVDILHAGTWL